MWNATMNQPVQTPKPTRQHRHKQPVVNNLLHYCIYLTCTDLTDVCMCVSGVLWTRADQTCSNHLEYVIHDYYRKKKSCKWSCIFAWINTNPQIEGGNETQSAVGPGFVQSWYLKSMTNQSTSSGSMCQKAACWLDGIEYDSVWPTTFMFIYLSLVPGKCVNTRVFLLFCFSLNWVWILSVFSCLNLTKSLGEQTQLWADYNS